MIDQLILWLVTWQFWAILAGCLIALEIFDGNGFAISFGLAAMAIAGLILSQEYTGVTIVPNWKLALLEYAAISVLLAYFLRKLPVFRKDKPDVNEY